MPPDPTLDPAALEQLRHLSAGDGGAFVRELVDTFLQDAPGKLAETEAGLTTGDAALVLRAAHTLKGSASNFGAVRFSSLSHQIEHLAKSSRLAEAGALLPELKDEFSRVRLALLATVPELK
jgi:HPt (histidine-containing phosphotransfer) domain-containing protein